MRGGEKVLLSLARLFPDAPIFTLLHVRGLARRPSSRRATSAPPSCSTCPGPRARYRSYLPLFPAAAATIDLSPAIDLVDLQLALRGQGRASVAPGRVHLCYCHTPMRYVWDRYDDYFGPGRVSGR